MNKQKAPAFRLVLFGFTCVDYAASSVAGASGAASGAASAAPSSTRETLTAFGHSVSTAANGLDGFEKAQQSSFHLYIVDHLMPLMNGVTLSKNLKQTPACAQTPLLFMILIPILIKKM